MNVLLSKLNKIGFTIQASNWDSPSWPSLVPMIHYLSFLLFTVFNVKYFVDQWPFANFIIDCGTVRGNNVQETSDLSIFRPTVPLYKISSTRLLLPFG